MYQPEDDSSPVQARITLYARYVQDNLVSVPVFCVFMFSFVLFFWGGALTSEVKLNLNVKINPIYGFLRNKSPPIAAIITKLGQNGSKYIG